MYQLLRSVLFLMEAEKAHYFSMNSLKLFCRFPFLKKIISNNFKPADKPVKFLGMQFKNPVGLAAGFDKNAKYLCDLEALGFSHVEIGTVTPLPQAGNDKPRLFRLPNDKALINRMGFNNDGTKAMVSRLQLWKEKQRLKGFNDTENRMIIGGNIGKNKATPNEQAWMDFEKCFVALHPYVDYFVVNVSSPNTPGLRELQEKHSLRKIFTTLQGINNSQAVQKPILLKVAPDLSIEQVDDVVDLALEIKIDGLLISNTTLDRSCLSDASKLIAHKAGAGGLSGLPVKNKSTQLLKYIAQKTVGQIPLIASGGIFTAADAQEKLNAGASLVQVWTGFIYEGPGIVKNIMKNL
ncbi:MAG TPA: quinone-dependent dihydroorotate dehydrogenase [Ferruginibacter sp.]|jgi:dihydroorotate dehydrogenase|nr:quinone-dependent dihydroorotate dehydrogenase [Chitinophagaceae bacterium]MBP6047091.1 quinone-dependent dihydroorotate dehydrogenase [Ferruginibacter sp.]MBP6370885.1 quinone-dependent dihydroorotate dehydrogenase [Ferruginibacter sp.]MBP6987244.1 quinone-dependent dihydroorotate dehydrogenase [Ferruginibacter sp.]MBP7718272.1 quinone-dependent dihydroorotate dehydrogenase [Ferruginibacter sp.]